ncbi:LOW QUALITY PROTEIN: vomeronasal type-1 receptor 3-like [Dipodomys spectabilis]|uniref:LOW QUALITY PROTEIN: vomeronasal type-1 receptor 3-like n=1 Tax=Dipodomys spectabilis TaxID=105255 RepID=UPI001C53E48F|nr:LOW QUALITY PROTEIN: vomeronasal type-1 receptor 3-like [Dipodomys spectabilis]
MILTVTGNSELLKYGAMVMLVSPQAQQMFSCQPKNQNPKIKTKSSDTQKPLEESFKRMKLTKHTSKTAPTKMATIPTCRQIKKLSQKVSRLFLVLCMKSMIWSNLIQRITLYVFTGPGILGNILVLVKYVYTLNMGLEKQKPIYIILIHLVFSNTLIICNIGIKSILTTDLCFINFLSDVGCKTVLYMEKLARGLSVCTTCLLTMVQVITISPRTTQWRKLKPRTAWQVLPYLLFFWVLNALISSYLLYFMTAFNSMNSSRTEVYVGYCHMHQSSHVFRWLCLSLMALRDVIFQSLMGWSSGYMVFYLYKHYKRVLYLHSSKCENNSSPEIRVVLSTLILMVCFLCFNWTNLISSIYLSSVMKHDCTIIKINVFLVFGYACLSPFILIIRDVHVTKYWNVH